MVRPPSAIAMGLKGRGSFDLINLAIKAHVPTSELTDDEKKKLNDEDKGFDLAQFIVDTVIEHVITPKVVREDPQPGEMLFSRISDPDLCAIFFDATGQKPNLGGLTGSVEKFRKQRRVPRQRTGSKNVRSKTKRSAG